MKEISPDAPKNFEKYYKEKYGLTDDHFAYHETDLYVRCDTEELATEIFNELKEWGYTTQRMSFSTVADSEWFGKRLIELPFARMDIILEHRQQARDECEIIGDFLTWLYTKTQVRCHKGDAYMPHIEHLELMAMQRIKVKYSERER